jgi:hypothetical protein
MELVEEDGNLSFLERAVGVVKRDMLNTNGVFIFDIGF